MQTTHVRRARLGHGIAILGLGIMLAACGGAAAPAYDAGGQPGAGSGGVGTAVGAGATAAGGGAADNGSQGAGGQGAGGDTAGNGATGGGNEPASGPVLDAARPDLLVIKTGTLVLEVDDVDAAVADSTTAIGGLGGYVSGSSQTGAADQVSASITYRIPADRWDAALVALRALAATVVSEQTQSDEVTSQVVDLAARVRNLQSTERAVQEVMSKATSIDQILQVQAELTRIRGEIEQATSAKAHLEEQATYSTLTVRFGLVPKPTASPTPAPTPVAAAFDAGAEAGRATGTLVSLLQRLATVGIWFGIVWLPVLLVLGLGGLGLWAVIRRGLPPVTRSAPPAPGPLPPAT